MKINNDITSMLKIRFPIIVAPMFLVSNEAMMRASMKAGVMGVFPTLNFRRNDELKELLARLNEYKTNINVGSFGVNLIVQKSNPLYEKHLKICADNKVPFYITSLGNPKQVIDVAHSYGASVFCDVTNTSHAKKCHELNCDGFIAVGQGAGGHAGPFPLHILISSLKKNFPDKPVIAAGGVSSGNGILSMLAAGASGVSIGTRFIASSESAVSNEYKNAIVNSGMEDIVMTTKISGTPCTIINTPYAKKIGYKQNFIERFLSKNKRTKKYFKMLVQIRGMKKMEQAIHPGNYSNLWCAGQSVELIDDIKPVGEIVEQLIMETEKAWDKLNSIVAK